MILNNLSITNQQMKQLAIKPTLFTVLHLEDCSLIFPFSSLELEQPIACTVVLIIEEAQQASKIITPGLLIH